MQEIYERQEQFNQDLRCHITKEMVDWQLTFVHGIQNEIAELLEHIDWHPKWKGSSYKDRTAIGLELADITKYLLCLWQSLGFTYYDMVRIINKKSDMVEFRAKQKFQTPVSGRIVIFLDLDGTIADWRKGFLEFLKTFSFQEVPLDALQADPASTLCMDLDFGWSYSRYKHFKDLFEREGGYGSLPPFADAVHLLQFWQALPAPPHVVVCTARPVDIARVSYDTFRWLNVHDIAIDELHMVGDERVQLAIDMRERDNTIIMFEDNPELALRAAHNGLNVVMRPFPYNAHIVHPNIYRTNNFMNMRKAIR